MVNVILSNAKLYVVSACNTPLINTSTSPDGGNAIGFPNLSTTPSPPNTVWFAVAVNSYWSVASAFSNSNSSPTTPMIPSAPFPPVAESLNITRSPALYPCPPSSIYTLSTPPLESPVTFDVADTASVSVLLPEKLITSWKSYIEPRDVLSIRRPPPVSNNKSPALSSNSKYNELFVLSIVDIIPKTVASSLDTPSLSTKVTGLLKSNVPLCVYEILTL